MELLECRHLALDLVLVHREFPSHCLHHLFSSSLKLHLLNQLFFSLCLCLCLFPFPCPVSLSLCLSLFSFFLLSLLFLPWSQMQKNMSARLLPESPEKRNFHDLNHEPNSSNSQIKTLSFLQPFLHTHFLHCATSAAFSLPSFGFNDSNPCSSLGSRPFSN